MKCIRMKQNGLWERPSLKEGITIKVGLEELSNILSVLKLRKDSYKHSYIKSS